MQDEVDTKEKLGQQYPQVSFVLNEQLDADKLSNFIARGTNRGGANFSEIAVRTHPRLLGFDQLEPTVRLKKIKDYVHGFYADKETELTEAAKVISAEWRGYSPHFFEIAGRIFDGKKWPEGRYVGYLSISPPYPRFLDSKTFHLPYKSVNEAMRVTAHEMLHFIFYDYVRQRYLPDMPNTIGNEMEQRLEGKFSVPLWELSEVFNLVILSKDEWGKGTNKQSSSAYSHLVVYRDTFEKFWEECAENIDKLFDKLEVRR